MLVVLTDLALVVVVVVVTISMGRVEYARWGRCRWEGGSAWLKCGSEGQNVDEDKDDEEG